MLDEYKELMALRAHLLTLEVEQFQKRYRHRDSVYLYFQRILEILQKENIMVLAPSLIEKIYRISIALAFCYPRDVEIQGLRKQVFRELSKQENILETSRDERVQEVLLEERGKRFIPSNIVIQENHVLEMYKRDFQNYVNIFYQPFAEEEIDLFYYLATVHRLYTDYPEFMEQLKTVITFTIIRLEKQNSPTNEVLDYINITNQRLFPKKNGNTKSKIISLSEKIR